MSVRAATMTNPASSSSASMARNHGRRRRRGPRRGTARRRTRWPSGPRSAAWLWCVASRRTSRALCSSISTRCTCSGRCRGRGPGGAAVDGQPVAGVVDPRVAGAHGRAGEALVLEPEVLDEPCRGDVGRVEGGLHAVDAELVEQPVDDGADGLPRQPPSLLGRGQRVPDRGHQPLGVQADGHVADEPPVERRGDLHPVAGDGTVERRLAGHEPARRLQRVGRLPALVPGDVRVGAVGGERLGVSRLEGPQHQPVGADREEGTHRPSVGPTRSDTVVSAVRSAPRWPGRTCRRSTCRWPPGVHPGGRRHQDVPGQVPLGRLGHVPDGAAPPPFSTNDTATPSASAGATYAARCSWGSRSTTKRPLARAASSADTAGRHHVESLPSGVTLADIFSR